METQRVNVALSNALVELDAEVTALEVQIAEVESNEVETYYRGVYSFCMVFNAFAQAGGATELVDYEVMLSRAYAQKWHERDAPGFEWPPGRD